MNNKNIKFILNITKILCVGLFLCAICLLIFNNKESNEQNKTVVHDSISIEKVEDSKKEIEIKNVYLEEVGIKQETAIVEVESKPDNIVQNPKQLEKNKPVKIKPDSQSLFQELPSYDLDLKNNRWIRARKVSINTHQIYDLDDGEVSAGQQISLNLFKNTEHKAVVGHVQRYEGGIVTIVGGIHNQPYGSFSLSLSDGKVNGEVQILNEKYQIKPDYKNSDHIVAQKIPNKGKHFCGTHEGHRKITRGKATQAAPSFPVKPLPTNVDVKIGLIVTQAALKKYFNNNLKEFRSNALGKIGRANKYMKDSKAKITFVLAAVETTNYNPNNNNPYDLEKAPLKSIVDQMRKKGVNIPSLCTTNSGGVAILDGEGAAFGAADGADLWAHEWGHNLNGSHTDRVGHPPTGWDKTFKGVKHGLGTLMTYSHMRQGHIPYFSNPEVKVDGDTIGSNAGGFGKAKNSVSHFRHAVMQRYYNKNASGFLINQTSLEFENNGGTGTFSVKLQNKPKSKVVLNIRSDDTSTARINIQSLTFTPANWNAFQAVKVTGVVFGKTVIVVGVNDAQSDNTFDPLLDKVVSVKVTSTPGFSVTPDKMEIDEGKSKPVSVVLTGPTRQNVVIEAVLNNANVGVVKPKRLTFTQQNWNKPQNITVSTVKDSHSRDLIDMIVFKIVRDESDPQFKFIPHNFTSVTKKHVSTVDFAMNKVSLSIQEEGSGAFTAFLTEKPKTRVVLNIRPENPSALKINKTTLTFTPSDWNQHQSVSVTALDDNIMTNTNSKIIVSVNDGASDNDFDPLPDKELPVDIINTDIVGYSLNRNRMIITEGHDNEFTIVLAGKPSSEVFFNISALDSTIAIPEPSVVSFNHTNWNQPQKVLVKGVKDNVNVTRTTGIKVDVDKVISDQNYNTQLPTTVSTTVIDKTGGFAVDKTSLVLNEGSASHFTVVLTVQPDQIVTINTGSDQNSVSVDKKELLFTVANWNVPQVVNVTSINDAFINKPQANINVSINQENSDRGFIYLDHKTVSVNVNNDDVADFTINQNQLKINKGSKSSFSIKLASSPISRVVLGIKSTNRKAVVVSPRTLTFTAANWNIEQVVEVTSIDDFTNINHKVPLNIEVNTQFSDIEWHNLSTKIVQTEVITVPGLRVKVVDKVTSESGEAGVIEVSLRTQPKSRVDITAVSQNTAEGKAVNSVSFTSANYNIPQKIRIKGVEDTNFADGPIDYLVVVKAASQDSEYNGLQASSTFVNLDNDTPGVVIIPIEDPLIVSEGGKVGSFRIQLLAKPVAPMTIHIRHDEQVQLSDNAIVFDKSNSILPIEVKLSAVEDKTPERVKESVLSFRIGNDATAGYKTIKLNDLKVLVYDVPESDLKEIDTIVNQIQILTKEPEGENESKIEVLNNIDKIYKITRGPLSVVHKETIINYLDRSLSDPQFGTLDDVSSSQIILMLRNFYDEKNGVEQNSNANLNTSIIELMKKFISQTTMDQEMIELSTEMVTHMMIQQYQLKESNSLLALSGKQLRNMDQVMRDIATINSKQFDSDDAKEGTLYSLNSYSSRLIQKCLDPDSMSDSYSMATELENMNIIIPRSALNGPSVVSVVMTPLNPYSDLDDKKIISQLVHIDIYNIESKSLRKVANLVEPIQIEFPFNMNSLNLDFTGIRYFDDEMGKWSNRGMGSEIKDHQGNIFTATTSHLTPFALITNPSASSNSESGRSGSSGGCLFKRRK